MKFKNAVVVILLVTLSAAAFYLGTQIIQQIVATDAQQIEAIWTADMEQLKQKPDVFTILNNVKEIKLEAAQDDGHAEFWLKSLRPPLTVSANGYYTAEVLVISDVEEEGRNVVIQMSFIDQRTGDLAAELARRYQF